MELRTYCVGFQPDHRYRIDAACNREACANGGGEKPLSWRWRRLDHEARGPTDQSSPMIDIAHHPELTALARTSDGLLRTGAGDVVAIKAAADRKVEFVCFASGGVLAQVTSAMVIRPTTRCTPCGLRSPCGRC